MPSAGPPSRSSGSDVLEGGAASALGPRGLIVLLTAVLLGAALLGPHRPEGPGDPAAQPEAAASAFVSPVQLAGSCVGTVTLLSSSGAQVRVGVNSPPALQITVGDRLTLLSTGPCGSALWMSPQRDGVFVIDSGGVLSSTGLRAVAAETVRISVTHWACVEIPTYDPDCRGLIALDGYVDVIVAPRRPAS